ncbi:hypothetical protein VP01_5827g1 [Puccinia sorghi]|uniref:DUF659 domain-containing protein n=1 Tax=Puccinia sorghi TaxID=27349 RepID=A0A0L6UK65_9BASI|nr:hypothetical protein VP01_5827g1 [Puccinia sorghi]
MISFTQDAWTSPYVTAFMAVTAHIVDNKYRMVHLTIAIPHVQELFYGVLKKYDLCNKVHTITADNASTNAKMACKLQNKLPTFKASEQLLGCITHVINLSAKAGLAVLGSLDEDNCHKISITYMDQNSSVMYISNLTLEPDGSGLDLKTVLKQIHGLSTYFRFFPQSGDKFTCLEIDHNSEAEKFRLSPTEWNQASNLNSL